MNRLRQLVILLPVLLGSPPAQADDPVEISVADVWFDEAEAAMAFVVKLSAAPAATVSVAYATSPCTATEGIDYDGTNGVLVFFPQGETSTNVEVNVHADGVFEGTETFVVELFDAVGAVLGRDRARGFLRNVDPPPREMPLPPGDFDGDGRSDLDVWYERDLGGKLPNPSGINIIWGIDAQTATPLPASAPIAVPDGWRAAGTADVDGDGSPDLIWHHPQEGLAFSTYTPEGGFSEPDFGIPEPLPPGTPATVTIVGTGDFSGDGSPDLLTWDSASGALSIWVLAGERIAESRPTEPAAADSDSRPAATGDFDGDGWPDVLWIELSSGRLFAWLMSGPTRRATVPFEPPSAAEVQEPVAIGDFDGDGDVDLVWQEPTGELTLWFLQGTALVCEDGLSPRTLEHHEWETWQVVGPR